MQHHRSMNKIKVSSKVEIPFSREGTCILIQRMFSFLLCNDEMEVEVVKPYIVDYHELNLK